MIANAAQGVDFQELAQTSCSRSPPMIRKGFIFPGHR